MIRELKCCILLFAIVSSYIVLYFAKCNSNDSLNKSPTIYSWNEMISPIEIKKNENDSIISYSKGLNSLNIIKHKRNSKIYREGKLNVANKLYTIYLYKNDMISDSIMKYKSWEVWYTTEVKKIAKLYRNRLQFLDIGCGVGVYTMVFASENIPGIAVDANSDNTDRTVQALLANNMGQNIKVLLNAVADRRSTFSMNINPTNIGGSTVTENKNSEVKSIFLDDLVNLFDKDLPIFMKIDIETYEVFALRKAQKLFGTRNIEIVLMEWLGFKSMNNRSLAIEVVAFFYSRGYKVYDGLYFQSPILDWNEFMTWPTDVVFRRLKYLNVW